MSVKISLIRWRDRREEEGRKTLTGEGRTKRVVMGLVVGKEDERKGVGLEQTMKYAV